MIRRRILLGVLFAVLFALGWWAGRGRAAADLYANLDLFVEVLHAVQTSYVDPVEPRPLVEGGLRGMLRGLDPYSEYLDEKQFSGLQATLAGEFDGVGLYVDSHEGWPVVISPVEGSPAWRAGLRAGDAITKIDGLTTYGLGLQDLAGHMRGPAGTSVTLTIMRAGEDAAREVPLTRGRIETPAVTLTRLTPGGVGYMRIASFNQRATAQVRTALDTLRARGARSLVLDLRGNPGGLVDQAVSVAGDFLPPGSLVVYTKGRKAENTQRLMAPRGDAPVAWPMAVLVDGGTASAAEILAGSLQDLDRALIVGTNSYGKGTVQSLFPLRNREGGIKLTTAHYYTPSGRSIHHRVPEAAAEDEEDDSDAPSDSATADSAARPAFRTKAGRVVYGGGGIAPDLEVRPDSTSAAPAANAPLALERDAAFQRAADVLRRAKTASGVFALAGTHPSAAARSKPPRRSPHGTSGER